ncbi:unnamed protein product [Prorocentrum cordatum]|uniref:RxLR effector protein n=1 Tax=Prorocentrum cordatum TaxID=2364126 RepID=A0ABN9PK75_9DINO|nr:unnamed protein product [Polarella glacialis]
MNPFGLLLVLCVALCAVVPASGAATDQQSDAIDAGLNTRNKIMIRKQHASSDDHADAEKGDQMYAQVTAEGRISYHSGVADDDDQGDELDHNVSLFEESDLNDEYDPTSLPNSSLLDAQSSRSGWWSRRRRRRGRPARESAVLIFIPQRLTTSCWRFRRAFGPMGRRVPIALRPAAPRRIRAVRSDRAVTRSIRRTAARAVKDPCSRERSAAK